jgi:hypothetical protein
MTEMTLALEPSALGEFRILPVIRRSFAVVSANWLKLLSLGIALELPALILFPDQFALAAKEPDSVSLFQLESIFRSLLGIIGDAAITYGVFTAASGHVIDLRQSATRGFGRFKSLVILSIYFGIGITLGLFALAIPGLVLLTMWFVATPACLVEGLTAVESLRRSRELTKGFRLRLLGLMATVGIATLIVSVVLSALTGQAPTLVANGISLVWLALADILEIVVITVAYVELRIAKEGPDPDHIAAVFD